MFNHVLRVAKEAKGELFIVAAGDDISYPERSKITVGEWRRSGACGLFGDADIIDADTNIVEVGFKPAGNAEILQWIEKLGNFNFIHGATAAYDSKIFEKLKLSDAKIYSEDAVLTVLICLIEGGIVRMNCRLVKYRRHSGAISNATQSLRDRASIVAHEIKIADYAGTVPDMCDYILSAAEECGVSLISINKIKPDVVKTKKKYAVRSRWMYSCFLQNAIEFARFPTVDNFYFLLPRIFGIKAFSLFKIIFINLNHIFDKR